MTSRHFARGLWLACTCLSQPVRADAAAITHFQLANGLTVLIQEDHRAPSVGVAVVYPVGTRDDPPGFAGLAHIVEHAMCERTPHIPEGLCAYQERLAAETTARTSPDSTLFASELPAELLERMLWVESERMAYALAEFDDKALARIRQTVRREWAERHDDLVSKAAAEELYDEEHAYRRLSLEDAASDAIGIDEVRWFFQHGYGPRTAVLSIVGDIDAAIAARSVERYFGAIQSSAAFVDLRRKTPAFHGLRATRERDLLPGRYRNWLFETLDVVWPTPAYGAPGDAELDVLAGLLGERLQERFLDTGAVFLIRVRQLSLQLGSEFQVHLSLVPGYELDDALELVDHELHALSTASEHFPGEQRAHVLQALEVQAGFGSRAAQLADTEGLPLAARDGVARYRALTASQVAHAAQRYLIARPRAIIRKPFNMFREGRPTDVKP
jgi:zinc protease